MESASVQSQRISTRPIPLATLQQSLGGLSSAAFSHEGIDFSGGRHTEKSDEGTILFTQAAPFICQGGAVNEDFDEEDDDDHSRVLLTPTEPPSCTSTQTHDPDIKIEEQHSVDAARVLRDILLEEPSFDKYQVAMNTYLREKKQMIDAILPVVVGKGSAKITWLVVDDIKEVDVPDTINYFKHTGIKGFDFSDKTVKGHDGKINRINFQHLLEHLWPGDWKGQLTYLNSIIEEKESPNKKALKSISEYEFWHFFGLLLAARLEGRTGTLWDTDRHRETTGILLLGVRLNCNRAP